MAIILFTVASCPIVVAHTFFSHREFVSAKVKSREMHWTFFTTAPATIVLIVLAAWLIVVKSSHGTYRLRALQISLFIAAIWVAMGLLGYGVFALEN